MRPAGSGEPGRAPRDRAALRSHPRTRQGRRAEEGGRAHRVLHLRRAEHGIDFPLRAKEWPAAADFFEKLRDGATRESLAPIFDSFPAFEELFAELDKAGWLAQSRDAVELPDGDAVLFV